MRAVPKIPQQVLDAFDPKEHDALFEFLETGEAPRDFLDSLDFDPKKMDAVELALAALHGALSPEEKAEMFREMRGPRIDTKPKPPSDN